MAAIAYTVAVTFDSDALAAQWLAWLEGGHLADVLAAGATDAEVIEMDNAGRAFEVRYHFPSREVFTAYERDHAPRLRAEGLKLFPPEKGVAYRRTVGTVLAQSPRAATRGL
jgi:hypothetical protein